MKEKSEQIVKGVKVTVCVNPESTHRNRIYYSGVLQAVKDHEGRTMYRVKHIAPWGQTSGWYSEDQVF